MSDSGHLLRWCLDLSTEQERIELQADLDVWSSVVFAIDEGAQ